MDDPLRLQRSLALQAEFDLICRQLRTAPLSERPRLLSEAKRLTDAMLAVAEEKYGPLGNNQRRSSSISSES